MLRDDLRYLLTIIDRGGPKGPSELSQLTVISRRIMSAVDQLENDAKAGHQEALLELEDTHKQLQAAYKTLEEELSSKKIEIRTLKGQVTKLEKKLKEQQDGSSS